VILIISNNIGTLLSDGYLCLNNDSNNPIKEQMINNNKYIISVSANNIFFLAIVGNIVISSTNYAFYYDNLYNVSVGKNVVLTNADTKITEITETTDVINLKAYLCNTFRICTPVNGFIKKDNKYYEISNSGTNEIASGGLKESCSSNINSLLKGGKLCITGSDNDVINFINNNTISYYMTYDGTNYKLVIAKSNLFIVAPINGNGGSFNLINLNNTKVTNLTSDTITSDELQNMVKLNFYTN